MLFTIGSKDNAWVTELKRRRQNLMANFVAARLRVTEEQFWWYIQEFGSASRIDRSATSTGSAPRDAEGFYEIKPVYAHELSFPSPEGSTTYTKHVWHPGVFPQSFVRMAIDQIRTEMATKLAPLIARGQMNLAQEMLMNEVMKHALDAIVANIAVSLPGTRSDGRLHSRTAADDFQQGAEIVEV